MRKLLPILCLLIIASCSKEISLDQTVGRQGIIYEVNSQTPFSGRAVSYYKNGQLQMRISLKDGKQDGPSEWYNENGQLDKKTSFKDGKLDGPMESYYENGQLETKAHHKDGELDGLYESYFENGQLDNKSCYKNGEYSDMTYCEK